MYDPFNGESITQTAWAVHCPKHGRVFLTESEYERQMWKPDSKWKCPRMDADMDDLGLCGRTSEFDDETLETFESGKL